MDNQTREDVRIVKTRRDLRAALVKLMEKCNFDKISVNEICKEALVNRMTFYKHYNDKYDLLNDVLLVTKQSIAQRVKSEHPQASIEDDPLEFTLALFKAVIDECLEHRLFIDSIDNNELVVTMVSTTIEKTIAELLNDMSKKHPLKYPIEAVSAATTGAASFLIRYWLCRQPEKTKDAFVDQAGRFLRGLFESGILWMKAN